MPSLSPIRTIFFLQMWCWVCERIGLENDMVLSFSRQRPKWWSSMFHGSWFFVLDTLSPTFVGALSSQLTQLSDLVPLSFEPRSGGRNWMLQLVLRSGYPQPHSCGSTVGPDHPAQWSFSSLCRIYRPAQMLASLPTQVSFLHFLTFHSSHLILNGRFLAGKGTF